MNKNLFFIRLLLITLLLYIVASCNKTDVTEYEGWKLEWSEEFKGKNLDTTRWSKIPRGHSPWNYHMSDNEACYDLKKGTLILRGIVNPDMENDPSPYLTGGIHTKDKVGFEKGRLEIRAKLFAAQGAWPAIWLLPFDNTEWPYGGEIDIMERLNRDDFVQIAAHSDYTYNRGIKTTKHGAEAKIDPDDYNIYAVELAPDSVSFYLNNRHILTYPRTEAMKDELDFPFNRPFYLLLDMQLGGSWAGEVKAEDLPVEMWIDWVRFYKKK